MIAVLTTIHGTVKEGNKRGKALGFPTANVTFEAEIPQGIYISELVLNAIPYPAVTFIGNAKTFDEKEVLSETYILDFNQDLYGKTVQVCLFKKIRENMKFESVEKLIAQMAQDEKVAREYFSKQK